MIDMNLDPKNVYATSEKLKELAATGKVDLCETCNEYPISQKFSFAAECLYCGEEESKINVTHDDFEYEINRLEKICNQ